MNNNGEVVKNIGDALMFRFANVDTKNPAVLKNILECCLYMIEAHGKITRTTQSCKHALN